MAETSILFIKLVAYSFWIHNYPHFSQPHLQLNVALCLRFSQWNNSDSEKYHFQD